LFIDREEELLRRLALTTMDAWSVLQLAERPPRVRAHPSVGIVLGGGFEREPRV
jgi:hypothetical protein